MMDGKVLFVGYDVPLALDIKHDVLFPILDMLFERIEIDGDTFHLVDDENKLEGVKRLVEHLNWVHEINITLEY
ncbi:MULTISPECIES: hypothetical protein [Geobacillus]|uniref:hypothetical protein n=1 Tax=Geobacillus TaxID=129337 RepID=UPI0010548422|nr:MULTISPECIES: hypothetical protein [Geobacillus]MED3746674.1 hypothetical protein [Geobacillus stearothermophilus]MED3754153.1 hypothetical protein [Geobacillus stearothermophilus]